MAELVEASGEVQTADLQPFLERVSALVPGGFGDAEVAQVVTLAQSMATDDEQGMDFGIQYGGEAATLRLELFMDDIGVVTLYFFAPLRLAELIMSEIVAYGEAQEAPESE